jgi:tetraacyldisaccharide 4'-kinase
MKFKKPKFWDYKKPNIISFLLLPFTIPIIINNFFNKFRNDNKNYIQKSNDYNLKTICVGNIYIGGTGKTPSSIRISQILEKLDYKTVFIKKNYTESYDEYTLLKKYGNVLSNSKRINSLSEANKISDVAIFDDGLQDSSIKYDLKFVCFNTKNFIGNGMLIPAGPLREKISSLKKYDVVLLNGNNENADNTISKIKKQNQNIKVFESTYVLVNLDQLDIKKRYVAFAGIGTPENFRVSLADNGVNVVKFLEYPDHWKYDYDEIKKIINIGKEMNAKIITTEKDYSRLKNSNIPEIEAIQFIIVELKIKNEGELINFLKKHI